MRAKELDRSLLLPDNEFVLKPVVPLCVLRVKVSMSRQSVMYFAQRKRDGKWELMAGIEGPQARIHATRYFQLVN